MTVPRCHRLMSSASSSDGGAGGLGPTYRSIGGSRRLPEGAVSGAGYDGGLEGAFGERLARRSIGVAAAGDTGATVDFYEDAAKSLVAGVPSSSFVDGSGAIDFDTSVVRSVGGAADVEVGRVASQTGVLVPPRIPAWPTPLDVSTQQVIDVPALSLAESIACSLLEANVDMSFDKDKCQFKCVVFNQGVDADFRVFLYSLNDPEDEDDDAVRIAVEFQRRCGDGYLYHAVKSKVWDDIDAKLEGHQTRTSYTRDVVADRPEKYTGPALPASAFDFSAIPVPEPIQTGVAPAPTVVTDAAEDSVEPPTPSAAAGHAEATLMLSNLLNAPDESVRAQGVRTAAVATTEDSIRDELLKSDLVKPIVRALIGTEDGSEPEHGGDVKTRAFAATALANITHNRETHETVVADENVVRTLIRVVSQAHDEETAQLRRESARALANLATSMAEELKEAGAAASVDALLADPAIARDNRLRTHAENAESLLA